MVLWPRAGVSGESITAFPTRLPANPMAAPRGHEVKAVGRPFCWDPREVMMLAYHDCRQCHGSGAKLGRGGKIEACGCALRTIFRRCLRKYLELEYGDPLLSTVQTRYGVGAKRRRPSAGRPREEYCADFILLARRTLDPLHWEVFVHHHLRGADWMVAARRKSINLTKGNFFHAVYRLEQQMGRACRTLQPYGLYPTELYFGHHSRDGVTVSKA
jgi:hypothetical protein